jgi:ATP-dependent protease ClpP protease subunit
MGTENHANGSGEAIDEPGIEYTISNKFIRNINLCMRSNPDKSILIHMKTCGGWWEEGMAIYDAIKACPVPITILNYTHARSMSSIVLQAANKRVMMPNSYFMFHDGSLDLGGTVKQVQSSIDFGKVTDETMMNIYVDAMKYTPTSKVKSWSKKRLRAWLRDQMDKKEDVFLTAEEAVYYGFADEIFGGRNGYDWGKLIEYTDEQLER